MYMKLNKEQIEKIESLVANIHIDIQEIMKYGDYPKDKGQDVLMEDDEMKDLIIRKIKIIL